MTTCVGRSGTQNNRDTAHFKQAVFVTLRINKLTSLVGGGLHATTAVAQHRRPYAAHEHPVNPAIAGCSIKWVFGTDGWRLMGAGDPHTGSKHVGHARGTARPCRSSAGGSRRGCGHPVGLRLCRRSVWRQACVGSGPAGSAAERRDQRAPAPAQR